jgi:hypothetical protein
MHVMHRLHVVAILVAWLSTACGGAPSDVAGAMGRVRLASNQSTYRDLGEALLFAAADDTIELAPGLFRGVLDVKARRLRVVGDPGGRSELIVVEQGLRVLEGGSLVLENLSLRSEGPVAATPAVDVKDSE